MLQIVNFYLFCYFTSLCAFCTVIPYFSKYILSFLFKATSLEIEQRKELLVLKNAQNTISMKDEFSSYSKLQRKINKIEAELKDSSSSRISKSIAVKSTAGYISQAFIGLIIMVSALWYRQEPMFILTNDLRPFGTFLSYPTNKSNAVSVHIWILISNYSMRTLCKPFLS